MREGESGRGQIREDGGRQLEFKRHRKPLHRVLNRGVPGSDGGWKATLGLLPAEETEAVQGGGGERSRRARAMARVREGGDAD